MAPLATKVSDVAFYSRFLWTFYLTCKCDLVS
jgi:hypothetical protein